MRSARAARAAFARHPWWSDSVLAALLTLVAFSAILAGRAATHTPPVYEWALLALGTVPIAVRRYRPVAVLSVVFGADCLLLLFPAQATVQPSLSAGVAVYTVASRCGRTVALRAGLPATALVSIALARFDHGDLAKIAAALSVIAIGWAVGDNIGTRRAYLAELEARAEWLEREREEQAARATLEERARIARELHDVIAHNVSVMVVQASAGDDLFDSDPQRAHEALAAVATTGRDALGELRRLLGVIRPETQEAATYDPQPGLARLPELLTQVRDTGLTVELTVDGPERQLPEGASLCAYRIIQEALTNTIKHARAAHALVSLHYSAEALEVSVRDDGHGGESQNAIGAGQGLIGMRERVALYGGDVDVGPVAGGGYAVTARLPVAGRDGWRSES